MKIGILGSGIVGQTLANGFISNGFEVMIGTSNPDKLKDWKEKSNYLGKIGSFDETSKFGEIIVLSVKGTAAKEAVTKLKNNFEEKIIIDTTNPILDVPPKNGVLSFFTTLDNSLMEDLQKIAPNAKFVKAFNSIGSAAMINPNFESMPTMFICGNDASSKQEVSSIIHKFGFEVEDMGNVEAARAIEPLCILWCIPGFLNNDWYHAFKILKRTNSIIIN